MAKLYDLAGQYRALMDAFESGELSDAECGELLRTLDDDINHKVLNIARMVKNLSAEKNGAEMERKRLQGREKTLESQIDHLKSYMKINLELVDTTKVKDDVLTVSIRNTGGSVEVLDEDAIPDSYKIPQPAKIDKSTILPLLKAGTEVPGCELRIGTALVIS